MKKIFRKYRKAKGFTLVELLIVIIIIGILAGMMMLATGAATDKAEATKIVSNMRNIKAAAVMYYSDTNEWPTMTNKASVDSYLDSGLLEVANTAYGLEGSPDVAVTFDTTKVADGIATKVKTMADNQTIVLSGDTLRMKIK